MSVVFGLVMEGDSLTYSGGKGYNGVALPGTSIDPFTQTHTSYRFAFNSCIAANVAVAGSRLNTNAVSESWPGDLTFRVATRVDALLNSNYPGNPPLSIWESTRPTRKYIFSVMVGTNPDTSNFTTAATNLQTYLQGRATAGFTGIVVCTILSRGDGILPDFETYRQGYNAILRTSEWKNGIGAAAVTIADFGNEPTIGAPGACNNAVLFEDTIHPTSTGYSYMTPLYLAAVNTVQGNL